MRFLISERSTFPLTNRDGFHEWVDAPDRKQAEAIAGVLWPDRRLILVASPRPEENE